MKTDSAKKTFIIGSFLSENEINKLEKSKEGKEEIENTLTKKSVKLFFKHFDRSVNTSRTKLAGKYKIKKESRNKKDLFLFTLFFIFWRNFN